MKGFFEHFLERDSLFIDKSLLLSHYVPTEVLYREELINEIANILRKNNIRN